MGVGRARCLIRPGCPLARAGSVREIEKLHAVGTAKVSRGLRCRLQIFHAHRRWREVMIAVELDRPIALRNELSVPSCLHDALLILRTGFCGSWALPLEHLCRARQELTNGCGDLADVG